MAASPRTRIGVVGLGQMGRYHTQTYRALGADVVAVCDADPARAAAFGAEYDLPYGTSFDELLATPGLNAVSICTPPHLHLPMVRAALDAGFDVLLEKPLASTLREGSTLADMVPSDRIAMLCFFHRFHEPVVRLRTMLEAGQLGQSLFLRNRFALDMRADRRPWVWDPARAGGGAVLNTSVHSIDLFRYLIGEPQRVAARMRPVPTEATLEQDAVLLLEGARGGPSAVLEAASYAVERELRSRSRRTRQLPRWAGTHHRCAFAAMKMTDGRRCPSRRPARSRASRRESITFSAALPSDNSHAPRSLTACGRWKSRKPRIGQSPKTVS